MCFLCDAMLGRLANWLRFLGYDTAYSDARDHELARRARAEGRILLTRDTQLSERRGIHALLVESDAFEEQLQQVVQAFGLTSTRAFSRCPSCNRPLRPIAEEFVEGRVPPYVLRTHSAFRECPECTKVYWRGSHWKRIREQLQTLNVEDHDED